MKEVLKEFHNGTSGGHLGVTMTVKTTVETTFLFGWISASNGGLDGKLYPVHCS